MDTFSLAVTHYVKQEHLVVSCLLVKLLSNFCSFACSSPISLQMQIMNRWLAIRIDFISNTVVFAAAVTVSSVLPVNAGLAGLAITSAVNLTDNLSWFVRMVGATVLLQHLPPCIK